MQVPRILDHTSGICREVGSIHLHVVCEKLGVTFFKRRGDDVSTCNCITQLSDLNQWTPIQVCCVAYCIAYILYCIVYSILFYGTVLRMRDKIQKRNSNVTHAITWILWQYVYATVVYFLNWSILHTINLNHTEMMVSESHGSIVLRSISSHDAPSSRCAIFTTFFNTWICAPYPIRVTSDPCFHEHKCKQCKHNLFWMHNSYNDNKGKLKFHNINILK